MFFFYSNCTATVYFHVNVLHLIKCLDMNVSTKNVLQLIEKGGTETKFLDCTNRFYTLVPHDFGLKKPPLLNSADVIKVTFKNVFSM